jgi:hypothetical protein
MDMMHAAHDALSNMQFTRKIDIRKLWRAMSAAGDLANPPEPKP